MVPGTACVERQNSPPNVLNQLIFNMNSRPDHVMHLYHTFRIFNEGSSCLQTTETTSYPRSIRNPGYLQVYFVSTSVFCHDIQLVSDQAMVVTGSF